MNSVLHLYFDGYDYIIAYSPLDAAEISSKHHGELYVYEPDDFEEFKAEKFTVITDDITLSKKTMSTDEWIEKNGRGFLCGIDEGFYED